MDYLQSTWPFVKTYRYWFLLLICFLFVEGAVATETHRGFIRINTDPVCLNHCDDYYLEHDDGTAILNIDGPDIRLYANAHVEITGARGTCGGCVVLYVMFITPLPTVGVEEISNVLPKELSLEQNYPNPFNPTTQLQFAISKLEFVTLKVYDIFGREIVTLVNGALSPGTYRTSWDASNMASGVYFYRLQTQGVVLVKRMILLR